MKKFVVIFLITIFSINFVFGENVKYRADGCLYIPFEEVQKIHPNLYKKVDDKTVRELLAKSPNPSLLKATTLPTSVINTKHLPPVGDQGWQGSCNAWASTYYVWTYMINWFNNNPNPSTYDEIFSPAFTYNHINDGSDSGSYPEDAQYLIATMGACHWATMPYNDSDYTTWGSTDAYLEAMKYRAGDWYVIDLSTDEGINQLKQLLADGYIAEIGIYVYDEFEDFNSTNNIYAVNQSHGNYKGGHAVTIIGYNDSLPTPDGYGAFRLVNSWGTDWGDNGYFWMTYEAIKNPLLCQGQAFLFVPKEQPYKPKLISLVKINHSRRGDVIKEGGIELGIGNASSPLWNQRFLDFIIGYYSNNNYQAHPFSDGYMAFDLTDSLANISQNINSQNITVYIKLKDRIGNGITGRLEGFKIIINATNYTKEISASDLPKDIPEGADLVVNVSIPVVDYGSLTPENNATLYQNWVIIDVGGLVNIANVTLEWNGVNYTMNKISSTYFIYNITGNGNYAYRVYVTYSNGNTVALPLRTVILVDTTPPTITINYPQNTTYNHNITIINVTVVDNIGVDKVIAELDGVNYSLTLQNGYYINSSINIGVGHHILKIYANDTSGNLANKSVSFVVDTIPPNITIIQPLNNSKCGRFIEVKVNVTDNENVDKVIANLINSVGSVVNTTLLQYNSTEKLYSGILTVPEDGVYNITVIANDTAGNENNKTASNIIVDTTPPMITINFPENKTYNYSITLINATITDNIAVDTAIAELDGVNYTLIPQNGYYINSSVNIGVGYHTIRIYANDTSGNTANKSVSFTVLGPDLIITQLTTKDLYYQTNGTIILTIKNIGYTDITEPFNLTLNISGDIITETINNLSINEEKTLTLNYKPNTTGKITITAIADPENNIDELNETNNIKEINVSVIELPVFVTIKTTEPINNTFNASIIIANPNDKRPITEFNGTLNLTNLQIISYSLADVNKTSGFFNGTIVNGTGTFTILKIALNITNTSKNYTIELKEINLLDRDGYTFNNKIILNSTVTNKIKIDRIKIIPIDNINISIIPLNETPINITVPLINSSIDEVLNELNTSVVEEILPITNEIKEEDIKDTNTAEEIASKILENTKPVIVRGFNITNKTKLVKELEESDKRVIITNITMNIINTSNKGFITLAIPIGNIDNLTIKADDKELKEFGTEEVNTSLGWYVYENGILEITLVKDPVLTMTFTIEVATESSTTSSSSVGGFFGGIPSEESYSDVAPDIKSEKIREIVHKAKLIVGSDIDLNLSARCLKNESELINKSFEITDDCILIGGPIANPVTKKYLWAFPVKINNTYPGKNRGVIQKQVINGHLVILLAGSDRWGTKAAVEYFKQLDDIPDEPIFVEWRDGKPVKIEKP